MPVQVSGPVQCMRVQFMSMKTISAAVIAGLMTIGVVSSFAQDAFATPEEAVAMRQDLMKEDGGLMRTLNGLSGTEAAAALQTILTNYTHIPDVFPEGSIVGDSKALPAIWEN